MSYLFVTFSRKRIHQDQREEGRYHVLFWRISRFCAGKIVASYSYYSIFSCREYWPFLDQFEFWRGIAYPDEVYNRPQNGSFRSHQIKQKSMTNIIDLMAANSMLFPYTLVDLVVYRVTEILIWTDAQHEKPCRNIYETKKYEGRMYLHFIYFITNLQLVFLHLLFFSPNIIFVRSSSLLCAYERYDPWSWFITSLIFTARSYLGNLGGANFTGCEISKKA